MFDLFGTLVDNFHASRYERLLQSIRETLGIHCEDFWTIWASESYSTRRTCGDFAGFEDCLREVCEAAGVTYDPTVVPAVVDLRMQIARENMTPRADTVQTLQMLRDMGLKIGLVSDCGWETPHYWPETLMAPLVHEAIFSCTAKLKKPDPRIYSLICERLAVSGEDCLYIGDCGCDELEGAVRAGMDAALICVPYEEDMVMSRVEARRWPGPRVSSVSGVLDLVNGDAERDER